MAERRSGRPSQRLYWVAAAIAMAGVVIMAAAVAVGVHDWNDRIDALRRVPGQEGGVVTLPAGSDVVYFEHPFAHLGPEQSVDVVVGSSEGDDLPVGGYSGNVSYDRDGYHGEAVATVHVQQPGDYHLQGTLVSGGRRYRLPSEAQLAIGPSVAGNVARAVAGGIGGFVLVVDAYVTVAVVAVLRQRAARVGA